MLTFLGLLVPRKVGGYKLLTQKKTVFLLCSMLTFLGCLVPREVIRRIHTIIPKESFLFHVKVSVMNCAVRPLLFERLMNVCSMDCQDYLFVFHHVSFMFDRFLLAFHHLPLICAMRFTCFDNVHSCFNCFGMLLLFFIGLFWF